MEWKLTNVIKETDHPFLNYYALVYDVKKDDGHHSYSYYIASRREEKKLRPVTNEYGRPDGVIIPTIYIDKDNKISFIFTRQFRPAINSYVYSVPAGLMDEDDDSIISTAVREVEEEVGAKVFEATELSVARPTSSGLSDEFNAVVLAKVKEFSKQNLEEFEEISSIIVPLEEANDYLDNHKFALQPYFIIKYLIEKLKASN